MVFAIFTYVFVGCIILTGEEQRKSRAEVLAIRSSLSRTSTDSIQKTKNSGKKPRKHEATGDFSSNTAKPATDVTYRTSAVERFSTTPPVSSKAMDREEWFNDQRVLMTLTRRSTAIHESERRISTQFRNISSEVCNASAHAEAFVAQLERKLLRRRRIPDTEALRNYSFIQRSELYNLFPVELRSLLSATDKYENFLLLAYAQNYSRSSLESSVATYNESKATERKLLKELVQGQGSVGAQLLTYYKSVRKGVAWNYQKYDPKLKAFFANPSALLNEYKRLKKDEFDSLDSYLNETPKSTEHQTRPESETITSGQTHATAAEVSEGQSSDTQANAPVRTGTGNSETAKDQSTEEMKFTNPQVPGMKVTKGLSVGPDAHEAVFTLPVETKQKSQTSGSKKDILLMTVALVATTVQVV